MEPEVHGLFIAEAEVPIFESPGLEPKAGAACGRLLVGDVILAASCADVSAAERGEEWLRVLEHRVRLCPSVLEDLSDEEGSSESESDYEELKICAGRGQIPVGGFVLRRHRILGTLLRALEAPEKEKWPLEAVPWIWEPGQWSLGLGLAPMSAMEVEQSLRSAALWLSRADALLVFAGRGMDVGVAPWPGLKKLGKTWEEMCTRRCFLEDPKSAWKCWLHYIHAYRETAPHSGYESLLRRDHALGSFVLSSSFSGHWAAAGARGLWELRGDGSQLALRCACGAPQVPWEMAPELPRCPRCGDVAMPAVQMLDEVDPLDTELYQEQQEQFRSFLERCSEMGAELVVLELGGEGMLRRRCEELVGEGVANCSVRLLRVHRRFAAVPQRFCGRASALPLSCQEALSRLEALASQIELGSFLFQDSAGSGYETLAPRAAPLSFALRKARVRATPDANFKAGSVLREQLVRDLSGDDVVPKELFFQDRDDVPPVVRVHVSSVLFPEPCNERLQQRLSAVWKLIKDLIDAYESEEYQRKFEAAPDRASAAEVIREVQCRVLPCHGFRFTDAEVPLRITQMQGFLQSGRVDPRVSPALEHSVQLSGYSRLLSKPMLPAKKSTTQRAMVLASPPSSVAEDDLWKHNHRPPKSLWIAATWNNFSPQEMKWDSSRFYHIFQMGSNGWESFQLLVDGRWEQCVYPSIPDGSPFAEYELRGPNSKGHGKNWTVGRHPSDPAKVGHRIKVSVLVNSVGLPKQVAWREARSR